MKAKRRKKMWDVIISWLIGINPGETKAKQFEEGLIFQNSFFISPKTIKSTHALAPIVLLFAKFLLNYR